MLKTVLNVFLGIVANLGIEWMRSHSGLDAKMKTLERRIRVLTKKARDIHMTIRHEQDLHSGYKRKREVGDWLKNVKRKKMKYQGLKRDYQRRPFPSRISLARYVDAMIQEASDLLEQGSFCGGYMITVHEESKPLVTEELIGQSVQQNLTDTRALLMDDKVSCIGIYGMPGVGKTAVASHIHNELLKEDKFLKHVYWFSDANSEVSKLQDDLATVLHLDLPNMDAGDDRRAAKLASALERKNKFVIILDGLLTPIDVGTIGIPLGKEGRKLIVVSRSLDVCHRTGCQKEIKVQPLSADEGRMLFMEKLRSRDQELLPDVQEISRSISEKYGGLPLGIIAKARSMIGANDIRQWRDALAEMEERPDDAVFEVMKSSFYGLRNERWKTSFLHCSILLKDETVPRDEVVRGLISEGFLDRRCREAKLDQGHTILKALEKACLLDRVVNDGVDCLKMHPLMRDMATEIMKSDPTYMTYQQNAISQ
ncbi:putative disease resistance protein At4g10780 [Coffea arabica]|uniref:Disease resistance protein At4g10780 n=1 Tax=Coffea arabica TaxID=13443 RepID=A0A6P6TC95_COFAR|nr:putative disease resistance protein At4g10780 [Coffea arabica]XP_027078951.1 putative disease resistance protein At4g10780 [Coffea arabica]